MNTVRQSIKRFLGGGSVSGKLHAPSFELVHAPRRIERRVGAFTANLCGWYGRDSRQVRYRLNGGPWLALRQELPRVPPHLFTVELVADELRVGVNRIDFEIVSKTRQSRQVSHDFEYRDESPSLPARIDWRQAELDIGDGVWETFVRDGAGWVRPLGGYEDYDRTAVVAGAFPGGRRVELDLIYRGHVQHKPFAFGVLPLWGGRPDQPERRPRRGWAFSGVWYYSHYQGIGLEFSSKYGDAEPVWAASYRKFMPVPGCVYHIIAEVRPVLTGSGTHICYRQRMCWSSDDRAAQVWMELADNAGAPLTPGEYGVAVLAHCSQVEFGSVSIAPLPPEVVTE